MRLIISIFVLSFFAIFSAYSQLSTGKLFVLNEGSSAQKGTIGYIDYATNTYTHIDSLSKYGNQITAHNGMLYAIGGNGEVHIYDMANNYNLVTVMDSVYARGLAFWGDKMVLTSTIAPFFRVYEKTDPFAYLYGFDETKVRSEREEVIVVGNQAYLSGFYGDSVVYAVDLQNNTTTAIATPPNPYQIEEIAGQIYVACFSYNPDFTTNTAISRINTATNTIDASLYLPYADAFTASNTHLYQKKSNGKILKIDADLQTVDTTNLQGYFYGFQYDKLSDILFYSETDFVSSGSVGYIQNNIIYPTLNTSISPRTFYFMSNTGVSVDNEADLQAISIYPNPAKDKISVKNIDKNTAFQILDISGKIWLKDTGNLQQIDIAFLPAGCYFLQIQGKKALFFVVSK